ncbi:P-loop NTPase fold protein [Rapidithrix thailandica]|uniref:P-loop NTPase fold protein n=1 Tax=Rapidithrix thailandica TaxID=413964 RepID=A0AAW9RVD6_9BACT
MEEFSIETPRKRFEEHLSSDENKRILFSGKFGSGKTYFLKKFFEEHDKYEAVHLYPVNYSVASNEDIFELVKYDILFSLLVTTKEKGKTFSFEKIKSSHIHSLYYFFSDNDKLKKLIFSLLNIIPKIGKSAATIAEKVLIDLYNEFKEHHESAQKDEQETMKEFVEAFSDLQGNIYERDAITQIIGNLIGQLKDGDQKEKQGSKNEKETILIIDDLDRIDPEHIFRVLNVFAAHTDHRDDENNKGYHE